MSTAPGTRLRLYGLCLCMCTPALPAQVDGTLADAITGGSLGVNLRYRFEHVDDEFRPGGSALEDAAAGTLRTAIHYRSGAFHGLSAFLELEQISRIFSGGYNEGLGGPGSHATVVDPDGTGLNQGYLQLKAPAASELRIGRQAVTYRAAPFHRYIGTILWRQNWQTFDAVSVANEYLPDTTVSWGYIWKVNRIFGTSAPEPLSHFDSDSHLFNIRNRRFPRANVEAYAYLLDFDNAPRFSSRTIGVRLSGEYVLNDLPDLVYAVEYAHQADHGTNPADFDADYQLFEVGFKAEPPGPIDSLVARFSYERLGGDGRLNGAFVTILGTNHAFQGTADRFLVTPDDGIRDFQTLAVIKAHGFVFNVAYHFLRSDHLDYAYGGELDLEVRRGFGKHFTMGLKYADYDADGNGTNRLRNGPQAADTRKLWFYAMLAFQ